MNILICGGRQQADYVLSVFASKRNNRIVVMNEDDRIAERISEHYDLPVISSDPTKRYSFEIADITNFDLVISLQDSDADNFVTCKLAKEVFHIKKAICTVSNPNNVEVFQKLGIDVAISDSYLLTQKIKGESDIESIFKTSSLENDKIVITEIKIKEDFWCIGKSLKDLGLPKTGNITCIFRDPEVIIPRGDAIIRLGDIVVIASAPEHQEELVKFMKGELEDAQK